MSRKFRLLFLTVVHRNELTVWLTERTACFNGVPPFREISDEAGNWDRPRNLTERMCQVFPYVQLS